MGVRGLTFSFFIVYNYTTSTQGTVEYMSSVCTGYIHFCIVPCVPLATEPGISLIILTPMKILQQHLNRGMFVV
jgi:hypothetical protein